MNALGWIVLLVPPIVAGGIASYFALRRDTPMSALNRGVYITWGLGIVLGFATGAVFDMIDPGAMPAMGSFFAGIAQVLVSLLAGIVAGGACALRVRTREKP